MKLQNIAQCRLAAEMTDADRLKEISSKLQQCADLQGQSVSATTRLYHDAGLSGTDFYDFMIWFSKRFEVDLAGFNVANFCPNESLSLNFFARRKFYELKVSDLINLAKFPSWKESGMADFLRSSC